MAKHAVTKRGLLLGVSAALLASSAVGALWAPRANAAAGDCNWQYCSLSDTCRPGEPKNCTNPGPMCSDPTCTLE
jgi:hypothetical protein